LYPTSLLPQYGSAFGLSAVRTPRVQGSISRCMTFTDQMYASMREFYFRGTPYPPGVGIDDSPQAKAVATDAVADQECDEQRPDAEDSDQDVGVGTHEKDKDDTCERVNCFPGRTSSAYIVLMSRLVFGSSR
jgi:hypothetical protein